MANCVTCKARCENAGQHRVKTDCISYIPKDYPKPMTNADRIRAMTDEEIEDWYWWMYKEIAKYTSSRAFVHNWLKQEVTIEYDKIDEPFKGKFIKSWRVGEPLREEDFLEEEDE